MRTCRLAAVCIAVGLLTASTAGARLDPSKHRKLARPDQHALAFLKTFEKHTEVNPFKTIGNVVFSDAELPSGVAAEKGYKLKTSFNKGDAIYYRAYRPAQHLEIMNKVQDKSVSKGCQVEVKIHDADGKDVSDKARPIETFDMPEIKWDQHRGTITGTDFDPRFAKVTEALGPGTYTVRVFVFDKIASKKCGMGWLKGKYQRVCDTQDPWFYLVSAGSFSYVVK